MFKKDQKNVRNTNLPQQFLQYEIAEDKFKMCLVNEQELQQEMVSSVPSGFKPSASSTPKRRSRISFEIDNNPPLNHLRMSHFIGEIRQPLEENNTFVVEPIDESIEENTVVNNKEKSSLRIKPHNYRSSSCEPWNYFQKPLKDVLKSTTTKDLNTTEKILKLILQSETNENDDSMINFENYFRVKTLRKVSETIGDSNKRKQILFDIENESQENVDENQILNLSSNGFPLEFPAVPDETQFFPKSSIETSLNDFGIPSTNDITAITIPETPSRPHSSDSNKTDDFSYFKSIMKNGSQTFSSIHKNQQEEETARSFDDLSFFKEISNSSRKTGEDLFSNKFASFNVSESSFFSRPPQSRKSTLKIKNHKNNKILDFPYFKNKKVSKPKRKFKINNLFKDPTPTRKRSHFDKEFENFFTQHNKQSRNVHDVPFFAKYTKTSSKDFNTLFLNEKAEPKFSNSDSESEQNKTDNFLEWLLQHKNSSSNLHRRFK